MRKTLFWSSVLVVCLACLWAVAGIPGQEQAQALPSKAGMVELAQQSAGPILKADMNFGRMPLYFIPNQGQMDERVSYYVQGKDKSIYFGVGEVTFSLSKPAEKAKEKVPSPADRLRRIGARAARRPRRADRGAGGRPTPADRSRVGPGAPERQGVSRL